MIIFEITPLLLPMEKDNELLEENSLGDLNDEDTDLQEDDIDEERVIDPSLTPDDPEEETDEEEEILRAETEFGEDPEYDDSVDDYDQDNEDYTL